MLFQYPRVGSLPRNSRNPGADQRLDQLSVSASRIVASKLSRSPTWTCCCANFQYPRVGSLPRNRTVVDGDALGQTFQYPRVGSLPRNRTGAMSRSLIRWLSVSASRIVASKRSNRRRVRSCTSAFSIRESDRCLETRPRANR